MPNVLLDKKALKEWADNCGITKNRISFSIGRSDSYINNCICTGAMSDIAYKLLLERYNLPEGSFLREKEKKATGLAYSISLKVSPDKVRVGLCWEDEELYHAYARVRGQEEKDLIQSISYAAHMIYKMAEQADMEGKRT